ncbi:hypothetical protein PIB30_039171 [Stylosanthes scabra]|uniref:Uncharacterized protein n=1 Tax=Stylosanthes scabra TaxID=79078 RepID=A0ABU6WE01_9FABA|nr:hypothetical protein [Stylosanthes scabra]
MKKKLAEEGEGHQIQLTSRLQKLPEEAFMTRHHDETIFEGSLTTHEARNVGNIGLLEFGTTIPDIGSRRPKFLKTHISSPSFDKPGPTLCGPMSCSINPQRIKI